jgi:hypothetical protein
MLEGKLYKDADSRLKGYLGHVSHPTMAAQRTYCFLCGAPFGYCSLDSSKYVAPEQIIVTCDDCDMAMMMKGGTPVPQSVLDAYGIIPEAQIISKPKE